MGNSKEADTNKMSAKSSVVIMYADFGQSGRVWVSDF